MGVIAGQDAVEYQKMIDENKAPCPWCGADPCPAKHVRPSPQVACDACNKFIWWVRDEHVYNDGPEELPDRVRGGGWARSRAFAQE